MKIKHSELIKIYQILMDALSESDILTEEEFAFFYDYYWDVPIDTRHEIYGPSPELCMGSIDHDLERIKQCILDNDPVAQHFRWLGNVLIAIADTFHHRIMRGESIGL